MEKSRAVIIAACHAKAKAILKTRHEEEYRQILLDVYSSEGIAVRVRKSKAAKDSSFDAAAKEQAMNALRDARADINEG